MSLPHSTAHGGVASLGEAQRGQDYPASSRSHAIHVLLSVEPYRAKGTKPFFIDHSPQLRERNVVRRNEKAIRIAKQVSRHIVRVAFAEFI